ncbi:MAG: M20/M25/M40 family metallo-hydrolase [Desulfobacteraceae bacterium]|nr:MAG: M20/M25/M40 family metallo-hydrolase [Desulfobacteraceae bacterium]
MESYLEEIPSYVEKIKFIKETILSNIVLIGQVPSQTFNEARRADIFQERMADAQVDECSMDEFRNPIGVVRGTSDKKPPIFVVGHLDTFIDKEVDHNYTIIKDAVYGPGIMDNSAGIGILISLPEIFRKLGLRFESDIVIAGLIHSLGKANLQGIRRLLGAWKTRIRGAICVEGGELGRLNYYSDGIRRCEVECRISAEDGVEYRFKPNAILILNDVINRILTLCLPQRPRARVIIGKISGGFKHGIIALEGTLGFEIQSDSDQMVKTIFRDINDIVDGLSHEYQVDMKLKTISSVNAGTLNFNHPLVKSTVAIMKKLDLKPIAEPSGSELSIFLSQQIPAVTLGVSRGHNYHLANAWMEIEPMYRGIAQIVGVIKAIDSGVCDE